MASKRFFGYYTKGNRLAIAQKDENLAGSSLTTEEYGMYKAPNEDISEGLEIEYSYAPTFNRQAVGSVSEVQKCLGWGSTGGYLTLFAFDSNGFFDLSSYSANDAWVYIDSGRWKGAHKIKSRSASGTIVFYTRTKLNTAEKEALSASIDFTAASGSTLGYLGGDTASIDHEIEYFKNSQSWRSTKYMYITAAEDDSNNGFFEVSFPSTVGQIDFVNKITSAADSGVVSSAAASISTRANDSGGVTIYQAYYEPVSIHSNIETIENTLEDFELDLPHYQALALTYYVQSRIAEQNLDFEKAQFLRSEFEKQLEKGKSALKEGPNYISGFINRI